MAPFITGPDTSATRTLKSNWTPLKISLESGSAGGAVSGSRDVRPTTASGCRAPPGNTLDLLPASSGDNRCGADVGTPADHTRFVEDDKRRVETNYYSKDNGGTGSSRLLRGSLE